MTENSPGFRGKTEGELLVWTTAGVRHRDFTQGGVLGGNTTSLALRERRGVGMGSGVKGEPCGLHQGG